MAYRREVQPLPKLGPFQGRLDVLLEEDEARAGREKLRFTRIHDLLLREGFDGSYDAVRLYAARWRPARHRDVINAPAFIPLLFRPSEPSSDHYRRSRETARELAVVRVGECRHNDDLERIERLRMGYPHGHRKTTTLVAGLRMTGMVAPMVLDGPINGDGFEAYVGQVLVPDLRRGDVVIMDNLSSYKRASVRDLIEAAGARLMFLPPYSPDFNPIEKAFARLKAMLRKAGERTVSGLRSLIDKLVDLFQPQQCANYFSSCGYDPD